MKPILQQLYDGDIDLSSRPRNFLEGQRARKETYFRTQNEFFKSLSEKQRDQFNQIYEQMLDNLPYDSCEFFIYAFHLGAHVMLEVLTPYETQKISL